MPRMGDLMRVGVIDRLAIAAGQEIKPGTPLLDVCVDLSAAAPQDCPPIYYFRVVAREKGWVRELHAAVKDSKEIGSALATISTDPQEPLGGPAQRALRTTQAGILKEPDWMTP